METPEIEFNREIVKGSQFVKPLFEFSGACWQARYRYQARDPALGDRMIINATGCSSIYGGTAPTCPYTVNDKDRPAWANSLFEDNAEYGFGMQLAVLQKGKAG